jgi:riboflavin kinase
MKCRTKVIRIKGRVFSGTGEGARFTSLSWFRRQIVERFGFIPYPGTLNLKLDDGGKFRKILENANPIIIEPGRGYCSGKCFGARLRSMKVVIVIPEVESYPSDVLEVIAPVNLREKFGLRDGDQVILSLLLK